MSKPKTVRIFAFDPTPAELITKPLRTVFKSIWNTLRKEHFARTPPVCTICQQVHESDFLIHGHEVYSFSAPDAVRLEGVVFVCYRCHNSIHYERLLRFAQDPYIKEIAEHYCKIKGGLSQQEFARDIIEAKQSARSIAKFYWGARVLPPLSCGPFQDRVEQFLRRREDRLERIEADTEKFVRQLREFSPQVAEAEAGRSASLVEAMAQSLAYSDLQGELPFLRIVAEGVIRDLSIEGIVISL